MADYLYINDYLKRGELAISNRVFTYLVNQAITDIPGISKHSGGKGIPFFLSTPVETYIHHGIVHVNISIDVSKSANIQEVISLIQNEVNNLFMVSTEQVPFDVQVRVITLI